MVIRKGMKITETLSKKVYTLANTIVNILKPYSKKIEVAGSIRRRQLARDIDILLIPKVNITKEDIKNVLIQIGGKFKAGGPKNLFMKIKNIDVDIFFAESGSWGAQLMTRTGPYTSNIGNRTLARNKGMLLNQYGLYKRKTGTLIAGKTEREIFEKLGKPYKKPEMRGL